ncbi:MAG: hypothetical protein LW688_05995 [Cryomorphaceae bacterium]|jgi:hypothetical protein|nr:hypothetical protein [Cryomorphaceae bacterium]
MDLQAIYDELYQSGYLATNVDYEEFVAGFSDYPYISELRKDLIRRDYEVVDVVAFFESIVDEIPALQKNDHRAWKIFSRDGATFCIVNEFQSSYNQYAQWIYYFNDEEDLELLSEVDSPSNFYNQSTAYLNSLPTQFDGSFIDYTYENVTEPMIVQTFRSQTRKLCGSGRHREAKLFLDKRSGMIKPNSYNGLCQRVEDSYQEFNLYNEVKGKVLHALENDDFSTARSILKPKFNALSEDSYEDIESIIEEAEGRFHKAIELHDQAEVDAAQEEVARVERAARAHEEMLDSERRFQEEQQRRALQQQEDEARFSREQHAQSMRSLQAEEDRARNEQRLQNQSQTQLNNSSKASNMFIYDVSLWIRTSSGNMKSVTGRVEFPKEFYGWVPNDPTKRLICRKAAQEMGEDPDNIDFNHSSTTCNCRGRA